MLPSTVQQSQINRIPIARITFRYHTSLYEFVNGEFKKVAGERIELGTTHDLYHIDIESDVVELANNRYAINIAHNKPIITFGKLQILQDNVRVCSRNGAILRSVANGQCFNIVSMQTTEKGYTIYGINQGEFISSSENVLFFMGEFTPTENIYVDSENGQCRLMKGESYGYDRVEGNRIYLHNGSQINIDIVKGFTRKL